jgi:hypothetical protein
VLAIKLVINTVIVYIKPIDAAFAAFERDLSREEKGIIGKKNMRYIASGRALMTIIQKGETTESGY